jgi:uncharacterized FlgJ-related protein
MKNSNILKSILVLLIVFLFVGNGYELDVSLSITSHINTPNTEDTLIASVNTQSIDICPIIPVSANITNTNKTKLVKKVSRKEAPIYSFSHIKNEKQRKYVEKYYKIALQEQEKFGIPASITISQGMIESAYGNSRLTNNGHNHFGIKYYGIDKIPEGLKKHVVGYSVYHDDCKHKHYWAQTNTKELTVVQTGTDGMKMLCPKPDRFVKYDSPWASFRHHSYILMKQRYTKYKPKTYNEWAWALKWDKGGYATKKTYHKELIGMIKKLKLYKLDVSEKGL